LLGRIKAVAVRSCKNSGWAGNQILERVPPPQQRRILARPRLNLVQKLLLELAVRGTLPL